MELRVGGSGNDGRAGGPAGDLFVGIRVEPSLAFDRRGQDVFAILDLSMTQVTLGADVEVGTLDGVEHLRIDAGHGVGDGDPPPRQGRPEHQPSRAAATST